MVHTHTARRRGRALTTVALLSLTASALLAVPAGAAQRWAGTIGGEVHRTSRYVGAGSTQTGDVFFTVGRGGRVSGQAIVAYQPSFETDGLDSLLSYAKSLTSAALGGIPFFGGFGSAVIDDFVSVEVNFDTMVIRRGSVSGQLKGNRLSLSWGGKAKGVPFTASILAVTKDVKLTSGNIPVPRALVGTATVRRGAAIATSGGTTSSKGVTEQNRTYWTAHRVG